MKRPNGRTRFRAIGEPRALARAVYRTSDRRAPSNAGRLIAHAGLDVAVIVWVTLVLVAAAAHAADRLPGDAEAQATPELSKLIEAYFRIDDPGERASQVATIDRAAGGSIEAIAEAIWHVQLWPALPTVHGRFSFESGAGRTIDVTYQLPDGYDPDVQYPVILCMPDRGRSPMDTFALARASLGDTVARFVLVGPARAVGGRFHQVGEGAGDLRRLVLEVRRRLHTDTDRVFVFGYAGGGEAAWMAAITHADLFAGVISLAGYPRAPFAEQVYSCLLANLRQVPVLSVWRAPSENAHPDSRVALVAAHNRTIVALAARMQLPVIGVEVPQDASGDLRPPSGDVITMLRRRRARPTQGVTHWFRYPGQGQAGWLRQTKFAGEVWGTDQLSILVPPPTDRDQFVTEVMRGNLAYLGGSVDRQSVAVVTQKCARIDLLLPPDLLDLSQPITVHVNGKKRHSGPVEPSVRVLLETAHRDWDFQRLAVARLSFSIRADGTPP